MGIGGTYQRECGRTLHAQRAGAPDSGKERGDEETWAFTPRGRRGQAPATQGGWGGAGAVLGKVGGRGHKGAGQERGRTARTASNSTGKGGR